ncbi:hypothetical protein BN1708_007818 [Verticillium longisporum]|uniref:DUF952 domain-containing protein n=2 Tax=Verticillium longisporum TaxID=100787 RepID=A0A0G4MVW3_VERLO|nr:hypothetical protein BN1708_007818 [Verticillium longisporum]
MSIADIPSPLPTYLYKIIPSAPPATLPQEWPLSDLDRKDGYIHLSTARQAPVTAGLFFKEHQSLWVLKLRLASFAAGNLRWEAAGSDVYPHLYGQNFGAAEIVDARELRRGEAQVWGMALEGEVWLE